MSTTPYHNYESFDRIVEQLVAKADDEGRGDDLDRLVVYVGESPKQVSPLGSFMMMLDEDWRLSLQSEIEAFKRWGKQKGKEISEGEILDRMLKVYKNRRQQG